MRLIFCFLSAIIFININGCSPNLTLKNGAEFNTVGICLSYNSNINKEFEIPRYFDSTLNAFIESYNSQVHPFKLTGCVNRSAGSLIITIINTRLVTTRLQTISMLITAAGLSLPFIMAAADAPFILAFAYLPQNYTETSLYLTGDISGNFPKTLQRGFESNPYFGSLETQKHDHAEEFYDFLEDLTDEIEKSYYEIHEK